MKIGFIGTGVMGNAICQNLIKAGYELNIYTRTKSKAENLIALGADYFETPKEIAATSDIVMTMLGYPQDVREVYLGENGLIEGAYANQVYIDMTTSLPTLAQEIAEKFSELNVAIIDAPVSGGDIGAVNGTLTIMCGGTEEAFKQVSPIFDAIGDKAILQGSAGSGQHTKMMNQIALAGSVIGAIELLVYADTMQMDARQVLESVKYGAAGSSAMNVYCERILNGDYEPGFYIKHYVKDLKIALEECEKQNLQLPGLKLAYELYKKLEDAGDGDLGTQALIKAYQKGE